MSSNTIRVQAHRIGTDEMYAEVRSAHGVREVSDAAAVTIAALWQSPGSVGLALAAFASGIEVNRDVLLNDIHRTRVSEGYFGPSGEAFTRGHMPDDDRWALDALSTFVINYEK